MKLAISMSIVFLLMLQFTPILAFLEEHTLQKFTAVMQVIRHPVSQDPLDGLIQDIEKTQHPMGKAALNSLDNDAIRF